MPMYRLKNNQVEAMQIKCAILSNDGEDGDYLVQTGDTQVVIKKNIFESIFEISKNGNGNGNGHLVQRSASPSLHRGPSEKIPVGERYDLFKLHLGIVTDMDNSEILSMLRKHMASNQHVEIIALKYGLDGEVPRSHGQIANLLKIQSWRMCSLVEEAEKTVRILFSVNGTHVETPAVATA